MAKIIKNSLLVRDSLSKSDLIEEIAVEALFEHIEKKMEEPLLEVRGQPISASSDTIPLYGFDIRDQVEKIIGALDLKKDSSLIKELKEFDNRMISYVSGDEKIAFVGKLSEIKKKIPAAVKLFNSFYAERNEVLNANRVLNGYSSLGNVVSMVKRYEDENDSLPQGDLYELFKEEEAMKEIRKDLQSDPYLEVMDNGYKLKAEAQDKDRTSLVMEVKFYNNYDDLVKESFSPGGGPFYETDETQTTYFVWVRADDAEKTILTARPKVISKEE
jgi:hypothetical protein